MANKNYCEICNRVDLDTLLSWEEKQAYNAIAFAEATATWQRDLAILGRDCYYVGGSKLA